MGKAETSFIMSWSDRMMKKIGMCGCTLCEALYYASGESETPEGDATIEAVHLATKWEANPKLIYSYIRKSGKWCMRPTWGCRFADEKPCKHIYLKE